MLNLLFMGTAEFGLPALAALLEAGHRITAVYTQPPRPAGRGQQERKTPVHQFALAHGLKVHTPSSLKSPEVQQEIRAFNADAIIVAAYGLLLPKPVLKTARFGCINIHPSDLPRWRGAAPIPRTILAGDKETALCIMQMDEGLDTGPILMKETLPVSSGTTTPQLHDQLAVLGGKCLLKTLEVLEAGTLKAIPQPVEGVTYADKLRKEEGRIDWQDSAEEIGRKSRGLTPWPGLFFDYKGETIKLHGLEIVDTATPHTTPGEALDDALTIACGKGAVRLTRIQRPGKQAIEAEAFLRGFPVQKGSVLE